MDVWLKNKGDNLHSFLVKSPDRLWHKKDLLQSLDICQRVEEKLKDQKHDVFVSPNRQSPKIRANRGFTCCTLLVLRLHSGCQPWMRKSSIDIWDFPKLRLILPNRYGVSDDPTSIQNTFPSILAWSLFLHSFALPFSFQILTIKTKTVRQSIQHVNF